MGAVARVPRRASRLDADLLIAPQLTGHGTVTLEQDAYRVRYRFAPDGFTVENLADIERTFRVDMGALFPEGESVRLTLAPGAVGTLAPPFGR